jgi:uncharacterized protein YkwD
VNLKQINEFRAAHGLAPLAGDPNKAKKSQRQNANRAARAQACRDLRAKRSGPGKKG